MREIKFRGKRMDNGEWAYGSLLLINNKAYIYPLQYGDLNDVDFGKSFVEVDKSTVSQYVGIKDINNKEVYEGDIIRANEGWDILIYGIAYNEDLAEFVVVHNSGFCDMSLGDFMSNEVGFEVIGNKYDNPKLGAFLESYWLD